MQPFIAVDWGTTNRRAFRIEDGAVVATERDDRGAATVAAGAYDAEVAGIRDRLGDLPMLLAGMVGSNIGWRSVPYVAAPAGLAEVAAALDRIDDRTAIVPGLSYRYGVHADVMRGEEVQLLGAVAAGLVSADALLCQPGTHCKWATVEGGRIARFTTAMTGELFALLRAHGVLSRQLGHPVEPGAAFLEGVAEGAKRDLAASLFAIRARGVLGLADDAHAASFASGLLIGADTAARIEPGATVHILADAALGALYASAIDALGGTSHHIDSQAAFVAGITRIQDLAA
ncbi:2-dehydro-3-deoxygalactonokinase [Sphingomonas sp. PAMC26645]|uniref:2-dehydro-3-deoxygalactonokinase n=1 Tax=Sphingomonas sp. PAMC26645 TaxID=2565555 RepID=UPI00109D8B0E|nr:2-dehydro-3-deoxygalactonokinase [Sphingomonas sp. PAMC26645]QCB43873.1 2-dehydro-3-deoxygalactonokinase [Sphingomonas sp. PAMC26645]